MNALEILGKMMLFESSFSFSLGFDFPHFFYNDTTTVLLLIFLHAIQLLTLILLLV